MVGQEFDGQVSESLAVTNVGHANIDVATQNSIDDRWRTILVDPDLQFA